MRLVDIMLSIPGLLAAIGIAALLGPSLRSVMIAIAVINVPIFARLLRGQMLGQRGSDYVLAATSLGIRRRAIVLRHVVPNSMSPVIVQATLTLATAIIEAAGLSFLGLGSPDPGVSRVGPHAGRHPALSGERTAFGVLPGVAIVIAALGLLCSATVARGPRPQVPAMRGRTFEQPSRRAGRRARSERDQ